MAERGPRPWDPTPKEAAVTRATVELIAGFDAQIAALQAARAQAVAIALDVALAQRERCERHPIGQTKNGEPVFSPDDMPVRAMVAEVATATRSSRRRVEREFNDAWQLGAQFPAVRDAFSAGRIDQARASVLVGEGLRLSDDGARASYERLALPHAQTKTVHATREAAKRIAADLEPVPHEERCARARRNRGVFVHDLEDGMAELRLVADAVVVHGAHDRLTRMSRHLTAARRDTERRSSNDSDAGRPAGPTGTGDAPQTGPVASDGTPILDERTFDQIRADLAVDLLLAGTPDAHRAADPTGLGILDEIRAAVHITLPVTTLTGLDDEPTDLTGHGPVPARIGRRLAAHAAHWIRVFHHPDTGALRTVDRYTPTHAQRRYLRARDRTCRFPGCDRPAPSTDVDHTIDHAHGGSTTVTNLAHSCRHHHVLKHRTAWTPTLHPDGTITWRSPAGLTHHDPSETIVAFHDSQHAHDARTAHGRPPGHEPDDADHTDPHRNTATTEPPAATVTEPPTAPADPPF